MDSAVILLTLDSQQCVKTEALFDAIAKHVLEGNAKTCDKAKAVLGELQVAHASADVVASLEAQLEKHLANGHAVRVYVEKTVRKMWLTIINGGATQYFH